MTNARRLAHMCKVLSVDTRVRIVQLLLRRVLCVGALAARLDVTQGAVSQHLRLLRDAGLVVPEKRGYYVHYRLNGKALAKWKDVMERFLEAAPSKQTRQCDRQRRKPCATRKKAAKSPRS